MYIEGTHRWAMPCFSVAPHLLVRVVLLTARVGVRVKRVGHAPLSCPLGALAGLVDLAERVFVPGQGAGAEAQLGMLGFMVRKGWYQTLAIGREPKFISMRSLELSQLAHGGAYKRLLLEVLACH